MKVYRLSVVLLQEMTEFNTKVHAPVSKIYRNTIPTSTLSISSIFLRGAYAICYMDLYI